MRCQKLNCFIIFDFVNVSSADCAKLYPKRPLHADIGQVFDCSCNVTFDHMRKGSIDKNLQTQLRAEKRRWLVEKAEARAKMQATVTRSFQRVTESRNARNLGNFQCLNLLLLKMYL